MGSKVSGVAKKMKRYSAFIFHAVTRSGPCGYAQSTVTGTPTPQIRHSEPTRGKGEPTRGKSAHNVESRLPPGTLQQCPFLLFQEIPLLILQIVNERGIVFF